ncbi:hypothetical protein H312_01918 [Anncaliia algerae PRA339]|uniref:Uncharacterized protein n=1 Tax=Anncaliia algerae PRA339 TaxID=1288291 RepID=A0A059F0N5_9MICR|nr:hypothetical protein H312_01918 [Anncaliia algerae PRA339]
MEMILLNIELNLIFYCHKFIILFKSSLKIFYFLLETILYLILPLFVYIRENYTHHI